MNRKERRTAAKIASKAPPVAAGAVELLEAGLKHHQAGRLSEAEAHYRRVLELQPKHADALHLLGVIMHQARRHDVAVELIDQAIEQNNNNPFYFGHLGAALADQGRLDEAIAACRQAISLKPDFAAAHSNLGKALRDQGKLDEAIAAYLKAISIKPDFADAHYNLGNALRDQGRLREAIAAFSHALTIRPNDNEALYGRGVVALLQGDFAAGWSGYEHRWDRQGAPPRRLIAPYPAWNGEDIQGKAIIVYEEQGLGDIIQFSRFLTRLSSFGARITFLVRSSMHRLLQPFASTIRLTDTPPQGETFDFQCALASLPAAMRTTLDSIPAGIPYLFPEMSLVTDWRRRLGSHGFKVGICWQGTPGGNIDAGRSVPLRCFKPITAVPGVRLISLQKTHGLDQLHTLPSEMTVENLGAEFDGGPHAFSDTAAVMSCLDLIITSDTSVAHLAGALGRPVWVALRQIPDWRWLLDRSDSPWYPTMKLYRQTIRNDWDGIFRRVAEDVAKLTANEPEHHRTG